MAADWEVLKASGLTTESLRKFVSDNFGDPGSDLKPVIPAGWSENPPSWMSNVRDPELRELGTAVHGLWKTLCRQVSSSVLDNTDRHTLLPLPYPFIVPGDRFRECYNWDSYWVIRGLVACNMVPAAEQLVRNLLSLVDRWGFVPNGARSYYTNRSQPPLLSAMVLAVWDASGDNGLLADALPRLVAQHTYWTSGNKAVRVRAASGCQGGADGAAPGLAAAAGVGSTADVDDCEVFELSRYHAELYEPRPESLREDIHLAASAGLEGDQAAQLYCDIASAAESGWDFSTRWYVGGSSLEFTRTTQVIPADLNAWLYRTERDIAAIAAHLGDLQLRDTYTAAAARRRHAMDALMWNTVDGCWHDLLLQQPQPDSAVVNTSSESRPPCSTATTVYDAEQRSGVYASNWVPLWCGCAASGSAQAAAAVAGLQASGLIQGGGLLTSTYPSGQQWDAPNAWPPLVHMAIEALSEAQVPGAESAAAELADRWMRANLVAWHATGAMHEKYDGYKMGGVGGGGEYEPQVGFGWSNGVLLTLLQRYGQGDKTSTS
ncbi:hypothetical protein Agub_g1377 [Astrephomene gubernaculifera]|uniref:Trehalase n=1 Tax=Astrephomene gubernaculifera TaxID=47775 RepID=A0AAD3DGC6_9CHLO|nr:hypothetical protein Agub_g1377 [Astrephomene gubernaculifera]